jgi:hypothetical protein
MTEIVDWVVRVLPEDARAEALASCGHAHGVLRAAGQSALGETSALPEADRHSQTMPDAWQELLELSGNLSAEGTAAKDTIHALHSKYDTLSDRQFNENRYYALGMIVSRMGPSLRNPEARQTIIQNAARSIISSHRDYCNNLGLSSFGKGVHLGEIDSRSMKVGIMPLTRAAYDALPSHIQLLADTLSGYGILRRVDRHNGKLGLTNTADRRYGGLDEGAAKEAITISFFAAAARFVELVVADQLPDATATTLLHDVMSVEELRQIDMRTAALSVAGAVHLDEFAMNPLSNYVSSQGTKLLFDRSKVSKIPERIPVGSYDHGNRALHDARIGCPALYIRKFIPEVLRLTLDIIETADAGIPAGWGKPYYLDRWPFRVRE